jgi:hypothetical protein
MVGELEQTVAFFATDGTDAKTLAERNGELMKVLDPGHDYLLTSFDGGEPIRLTFVKRNDPPEEYPGNENAHPGTQLQEVLRVLIERCRYVNGQFPWPQTTMVINNLQASLWLLEQRHAERHGDGGALGGQNVVWLEAAHICLTCGHVTCSYEEEGHDSNQG